MNAVFKKSSFPHLLVANDQIDRITFKSVFSHYKDDDFGSLDAETSKSPLPVEMFTESGNAIIADTTLFRSTLTDQQAIRDMPEPVDLFRTTEAKYRTLVEQIPAITYIASLDNPGKLLYLSPQIHQLGFPPDYWLDDPQGWLKRVHTDDQLDAIEAFAHTYEHHAPLRCEYRLIKNDGQVRWFLDEAVVVRDEAGESLFLQGILVDITKDKEIEQELFYYRRHLEELVVQRTEQLEKQCAILKSANANLGKMLSELRQSDSALSASEERFRLLLESAGEGILGLDVEGRCTFVNRAALTMLGYNQEELMDQDIHLMIHQSGADVALTQTEQWAVYCAFRDGTPQRSTQIFRCKDGCSLPVECSSYPIELDGRIDGAVLVFWDVTESQSLMQSLAYQASHDPLTGLINRTEFERRLARILTSVHEEQSEHVLCYLDLDHFKPISDSCGHAAGDELLRALSALLKSKLRQRDTLARLGGDEFALLLEHSRLDQAWDIANELCECVQNFSFTWEGKVYSVGVSIGMAPLTSDERDIRVVLSAADAACYIAKEQGRNQVHICKTQAKELTN